MAAPGVLVTKQDITDSLSSIAQQRGALQCLFNQGKYVYQTSIMAIETDAVYFDFDGIEETTLMSIIDFYSPAVFVFFNHGLRYQFLAKNSEILHYAGRTCLKIPYPGSITVVPGRKSVRYDLPADFAALRVQIEAEDFEFTIREMSEGGLSMWSSSSHGLTPHSTLKGASVQFADGVKVNCSLEIVRINYTLDDPDGRTHIISCQFSAISPKDAGLLVSRIKDLSPAD